MNQSHSSKEEISKKSNNVNNEFDKEGRDSDLRNKFNQFNKNNNCKENSFYDGIKDENENEDDNDDIENSCDEFEREKEEDENNQENESLKNSKHFEIEEKDNNSRVNNLMQAKEIITQKIMKIKLMKMEDLAVERNLYLSNILQHINSDIILRVIFYLGNFRYYRGK